MEEQPQPPPPPKKADDDDDDKTLSPVIGLVVILLLGGGWIWHDQRTVAAAREHHATLTAANEMLAGYATTPPEDGALDGLQAHAEAVVTAQGGAESSPLFNLLGREPTLRAARANVGSALALLARLEVVTGDLAAAKTAVQRYETETKDDFIPGDVEAEVWRVNEIAEHPAAKALEQGQRLQVLFSTQPVDDAIKALSAPKD